MLKFLANLLNHSESAKNNKQTARSANTTANNTKFTEIPIPERQEPQPPFLSFCREIKQSNDEHTAYFKDGELYDVSPRNKDISLDEDRGVAYDARYIVSNNIKYDLCSPESISAIEIPYNGKLFDGGYVTRDLSYILKMHATAEYRPRIAVPLIYKVANLMMASSVGWSKKDYFRLVIQLWRIGEIKYGDHLLKELTNRLPFMEQKDLKKYYCKKQMQDAFSLAKELNTDFVEVTPLEYVCEQCSTFHNRVYSISGNCSFLPKLPQSIIDNGMHCGNSFHARFIDKTSTLSKYTYADDGTVTGTTEVNAIEYSNRPFVDTRTEAEKQQYKKRQIENTKREQAEENYYDRTRYIVEYDNALEYQLIKELLGDDAPKNYSGYRRMKSNNTKNYQKLVEIASKHNIKIN